MSIHGYDENGKDVYVNTGEQASGYIHANGRVFSPGQTIRFPDAFESSTSTSDSISDQGRAGGYSTPAVPSAAEIFFLKTIKILFFTAIASAVLGFIGFKAYIDLNQRFTPKYTTAGLTTFYTAAEISRFNYLPWNHGKWLSLHGKDIVVTGTLEDVQMRAPGNITLKGDLIHCSIRADNGILRATNTVDSALTADDVSVTGKSANTRQSIEGYYFSHGQKTRNGPRPVPKSSF